MSGDGVTFAHEDFPPPGEARPVAPGVYWLRMPLPFKLDHINLWLLEDGDSWTLFDTGIARDEVRDAWEIVIARNFTAVRPLKRILVSHFHPDHLGLAGWLTERFDVPLWMTVAEWAVGNLRSLDDDARLFDPYWRFYARAGFTDGLADAVRWRIRQYPKMVSPPPPVFRRMEDGEEIMIGGRSWRVIVCRGHSPKHACLFCEELQVLIAGDQVLPKISPNISVWPDEPEADPLARYLDSLAAFRPLSAGTLVLPSHNLPFTGLHARLDQLAQHHDDRLGKTLAACAEPRTGIEVQEQLFQRNLDDHQLFFAIGETLAHLHFLIGSGQIERVRRDGEADRFVRASMP
ncbi:MAG: MBL fold metallo-hydrolase [Alphaproteobacteria bacterium]